MIRTGLLVFLIFISFIKLYARDAVAVYPIRNKLLSSSEELLLREEISLRLSELDLMEMIERERLDEILQELSAGNTDDYDEDTLLNTGKLLKANLILMGSLIGFNKRWILSLRLIDIESGSVIASVKTEGNDIKMIIRKIKDAIFQIGVLYLHELRERKRQENH